MQIQSTNNVQFGAKYISPATIKVKAGKRWKDSQVNFIKFNVSKKEDVKALNDVNALWGDRNLSGSIVEEVKNLGKDTHVYGVTTQTAGFDTVDSSKILGLVTTDKIAKGVKEVGVYRIGTTPKYAYAQNKRKRDIKHIATAMYESVKNLASKKAKAPIVCKNVEPEDSKFLSKLGVEV